MVKSVQITNDEKNYNFLSLLDSNTKLSVEKMSDFERFALLCDNLPLVAGSRVGREFVSALSFDLGFSLEQDALFDREVQKALWRRLNGDVAVDLSIAKERNNKITKQINRTGKISVLRLDLALKSMDRISKDMEAFIENASGYDAISLDMSDFLYTRPDEYHSGLVYNKLRAGDVCDKCQISLLASWVICRVLMRKNTRLYFYVNKDMQELKRLLKLFEDRELYPEISICFSDIEMSYDVARICLEAKEKNISSEIIVTEDMKKDEILNFIKTLVYELPITRISLCELVSNDVQRKLYIEAMEYLIKSWEEI